MHPVLAGAEIDRAHGQAVQDVADLVRAQPVDPRRVPVAEIAGEVALVGEPETERECSFRVRDTVRHGAYPPFGRDASQ